MIGGGSFRISSNTKLRSSQIIAYLYPWTLHLLEWLSNLNLLDQTSSLHLVQDFLLGLCLSYQVCIRSGRGDESEYQKVSDSQFESRLSLTF